MTHKPHNAIHSLSAHLSSLVAAIVIAIIIAIFAPLCASAAVGTVSFTTDAPAGTKLRIQASPFDFTVTGADKGYYFGEYLSKGPGTVITVSAEALGQLEVYGCSLSALNVVSAPDLYILKCYDNSIAALDLTACPALEILDCHANALTALDLSHTPILQSANVAANDLRSLTVGSQPCLTALNCSANRSLASLDLTACPVLADLYMQHCSLSSLDLSACPMLEWIFAFDNGLTGTAMTQFIANMPEARTTGLIYITDTQDSAETNLCNMADVRLFAAKGWATMDYCGGASSDSQIGFFYPGADYEPEVSARTIAFTTSRAPGQTVTLSISASDAISISGVLESPATGTKTYTLTSSSVTVAGDVTAFECPANDITALSLSDPVLLKRLECQDNRITSLDLSGARALTTLYCQQNELTSLNLSDCNALLRVDCYRNRLRGASMSAMIASLPSSNSEPYLFVIDTRAPAGTESNVATVSNVSAARAKGWRVFDFIGGDRYGMGTDYAGSEPVTPDEHFTVVKNTPDRIMINVRFSDPDYTPVVEGATISSWNGSQLMIAMTGQEATVYGDAVELLILFADINGIDVSGLPNLEKLNVALNDLTSLDLAGCSRLTELSCECNLLTSLDLSDCTSLSYLNCYGNCISAPAMASLVASLPVLTPSAPGMLIVRDASYQGENNVCLAAHVAEAAAHRWLVYELDDDDPVLYPGADAAGIHDISVTDAPLSYDPADMSLTSSAPSPIELYTASGRMVARSLSGRLSLASCPPGIYVARCGSATVKIAR